MEEREWVQLSNSVKFTENGGGVMMVFIFDMVYKNPFQPISERIKKKIVIFKDAYIGFVGGFMLEISNHPAEMWV